MLIAPPPTDPAPATADRDPTTAGWDPTNGVKPAAAEWHPEAASTPSPPSLLARLLVRFKIRSLTGSVWGNEVGWAGGGSGAGMGWTEVSGSRRKVGSDQMAQMGSKRRVFVKTRIQKGSPELTGILRQGEVASSPEEVCLCAMACVG